MLVARTGRHTGPGRHGDSNQQAEQGAPAAPHYRSITTCMKLSAGFSRLLPAILMGVFYAVCFGFLTLALKKVDVSVAYAIWSGVGTALIATIGILWFREPLTVVKA